MISIEEYLLLSGIQHFCFCKRQWGLIHIENQWEDNVRTFGGTLMHQRADDPFFTESRGTIVISRSMPIISHKLKLTGVADVVEFHKIEAAQKGIQLKDRSGGWKVIPIEYKYGQPKEHNSDKVQLCAQAICLEEMFNTSIESGNIYYGKIKHRIDVVFNQQLRDEVHNLVGQMYEYYNKEKTPIGLLEEQCKNCSLKNICLPELSQKSSKVQKYINKSIRENRS